MSEKLKTCAVIGCDKPRYAKSLCKMHYARFERTGRVSLKSMAERLLEKSLLNSETECVEWLGFKNDLGYGRFRANGKKELTHRESYRTFIGEIPENKRICHHCDNPSCINPTHLFAGTDKDNIQDCIKKGRFKGWENSPWI